jgi:hypothetical protein
MLLNRGDSMKVYKRGDNGEFLMHSDTYLGEDYISPNLVHWKYIKKERKNGRWVYYYDDSAYKPDTEQGVRDYITAYNSKNDYQMSKERYDKMLKNINKMKKEGKKVPKSVPPIGFPEFEENRHAGTSSDNLQYWKNRAAKSKKTYETSYQKYNNVVAKEKAYYKPTEKVKRALAKVGAKTLDTLSSGIHKAKNFFKSIFG